MYGPEALLRNIEYMPNPLLRSARGIPSLVVKDVADGATFELQG